MINTSRIRLALAAAGLCLAPAALAADYDPPIFVEDPAEYVPVEIGSGWYLRGDVGYNFNHPYADFERPGGFVADPSGYREKENQFFGGVGMGYYLNDWLRVDVNASMLSGNRFSRDYTADTPTTACVGTETVTVVNAAGDVVSIATNAGAQRPCAAQNNGRNQAFTGMLNGYVDLGTYVGLTPYVSAGVGLSHNSYRSAIGDRICSASQTIVSGGGTTTTTTFLCAGQAGVQDDPVAYAGLVDSQKKFGLAYQVGGGFAYQIANNTKLDFGYQYTKLPDAEFVVDENGTHVIYEGLDYHQFKVGVRYDLW